MALLYHLVGRSFGPEAGLRAVLALATTPISVATIKYALYTYYGLLCGLALVARVVAAENHSEFYLPFWGRGGKAWRRATTWGHWRQQWRY